MRCRLVLAVVLTLLFASAARAEDFLHKHVRVKTNKGRKVVGVVVVEDEDSMTLEIGKGSTNSFARSDIDMVESIEPLWAELEKKKAAAKTGEDWYQLAVAFEKEG